MFNWIARTFLLCAISFNAQAQPTTDLNAPSSFYGLWEGEAKFPSFSSKMKMALEIRKSPVNTSNAKLFIWQYLDEALRMDTILVTIEDGQLSFPYRSKSVTTDGYFCNGKMNCNLLDSITLTGSFETSDKGCSAVSFKAVRIKTNAQLKEVIAPEKKTAIISEKNVGMVASTSYQFRNGIKSEWVATGSSGTFNWFSWKVAPAPIKELAKKISVHWDPATKLFGYMNKESAGTLDTAQFEIAVTDLDNDGILGLVLRSRMASMNGTNDRLEVYENAGRTSVAKISGRDIFPADNGIKDASGEFFELAAVRFSPYNSLAKVPLDFKSTNYALPKAIASTTVVPVLTGKYQLKFIDDIGNNFTTFTFTVKRVQPSQISIAYASENEMMCDINLSAELKKVGLNLYAYSFQAKGEKISFQVRVEKDKLVVVNANCISADDECSNCPEMGEYKLVK